MDAGLARSRVSVGTLCEGGKGRASSEFVSAPGGSPGQLQTTRALFGTCGESNDVEMPMGAAHVSVNSRPRVGSISVRPASRPRQAQGRPASATPTPQRVDVRPDEPRGFPASTRIHTVVPAPRAAPSAGSPGNGERSSGSNSSRQLPGTRAQGSPHQPPPSTPRPATAFSPVAVGRQGARSPRCTSLSSASTMAGSTVSSGSPGRSATLTSRSLPAMTTSALSSPRLQVPERLCTPTSPTTPCCSARSDAVLGFHRASPLTSVVEAFDETDGFGDMIIEHNARRHPRERATVDIFSQLPLASRANPNPSAISAALGDSPTTAGGVSAPAVQCRPPPSPGAIDDSVLPSPPQTAGSPASPPQYRHRASGTPAMAPGQSPVAVGGEPPHLASVEHAWVDAADASSSDGVLLPPPPGLSRVAASREMIREEPLLRNKVIFRGDIILKDQGPFAIGGFSIIRRGIYRHDPVVLKQPLPRGSRELSGYNAGSAARGVMHAPRASPTSILTRVCCMKHRLRFHSLAIPMSPRSEGMTCVTVVPPSPCRFFTS